MGEVEEVINEERCKRGEIENGQEDSRGLRYDGKGESRGRHECVRSV